LAPPFRSIHANFHLEMVTMLWHLSTCTLTWPKPEQRLPIDGSFLNLSAYNPQTSKVRWGGLLIQWYSMVGKTEGISGERSTQIGRSRGRMKGEWWRQRVSFWIWIKSDYSMGAFGWKLSFCFNPSSKYVEHIVCGLVHMLHYRKVGNIYFEFLA